MIQNAINQLLYMLSCYEGVKLMVQSDNLYIYNSYVIMAILIL